MNGITKWLKKYFIPHAGNDYRPHLLRHETMMIFFLGIIIIELGFLAQVFIVFDKTKFLASVLPGVLTSLTNEEREESNLPPLTENTLLKRAAELKAQNMAEEGYFAHTSPKGLTPWHWLDQVGYKYTMAGENLAVNFHDSEDVEDAWMNSPSHRANIVKDGYTEIGIGVASGYYQGKKTIFVAQFFGTPAKVVAVTQVLPTPQRVGTPIASVGSKKVTPPKPATPASQLVQNPSPAPLQVLGEENPGKAIPKPNQQSRLRSLADKILTSPFDSVNYTYGVIAFIILLALVFAVFIRNEIHHPAIIVRGVALVAVIIFLFIVNIRVLDRGAKVPAEGLEAAVIIAN